MRGGVRVGGADGVTASHIQRGLKKGSKGAQRGLKGGSTRGLKGPWGLGGDTHTLQIYNHIITCLALHLL